MAVSRPTADVLFHRARSAFRAAFASLAGRPEGIPSTLGLALAPMAVRAALQVMPAIPASPAVPPDLSASLGPHGAGLLDKIAAAFSTRLALTAAAATLAVGGGVVGYRAVGDGRGTDHPGASGATPPATQPVGSRRTPVEHVREGEHGKDHGWLVHVRGGHDSRHDGAHSPADGDRAVEGTTTADGHLTSDETSPSSAGAAESAGGHDA